MSVLAALWLSVTVSSIASASLPAVTVTVWAVAQFSAVKVSVAGLGLTSLPACPATVTTTFPAGWLSRTTV